jgi:antitoxin component of MazEF toxin-antitoxin module
MKTIELKVARIGNSRGVRLPAEVLRRYRIGERVFAEEKAEGILLRPTRMTVEKLSWEDTARQMAADQEDWEDWDGLSADGLDSAPWASEQVARVAERGTHYGTRHPKRKRP